MSTAYAARVVGLADEGPLVRVPMLGASQEWGPLTTAVPDLAEGDQVVVMPLGTSDDRLHVLGRLQARQTLQGEIPGLADRLDDIEARDAAQDVRLAGIDTLDATQNGRLTAVEGRASAVETVNGTQNGRLTAVEGVNSAQADALTANATNIAANGTRITNLDAAALHKTGAESKSGILTLTDQPVVPPATLATSPVRGDDTRVAGRTATVRLVTANNANVPYTGGQGDLYAAGSWVVVDGDATMYSMIGGFSALTPGIAGYWWINFRSLWVASVNTADAIVGFVVKNTRSGANSVARDARRYVPNGTDGSPVQAIDRVKLTATDVLYWGHWTPVNSAIVPGVPALNSYTQITVSYDGPA